jgi:hypothetical protein
VGWRKVLGTRPGSNICAGDSSRGGLAGREYLLLRLSIAGQSFHGNGAMGRGLCVAAWMR